MSKQVERHRRLTLGLAMLIGGCSQDGVPLPTSTDPIACPLDGTDVSGACWERTAPYGSGAFPDEWRPGTFPMGLSPLLAFRDDLWMVGRNRSWSSADGLTWTPHPGDADWGERIGQTHAFFGGQLLMFGGLAYDTRTVLNDVWRSSDGAHWERVGTAAWPPRLGATVVAFKDKLWLLGGGVHVGEDRSPDRFVNDVWRSDDGVSWTEVTTAAPWPATDHPRAVVFGDALYLLGGQGHAEVWRSPDGVAWTQLTPAAAWGDRFDHGAQLFDGRLWVYGGEPAPRAVRRRDVPIPALNDVWYSQDGVTWLRQVEHGPWSPRTTMTSVVFKDRLWLFSGKHTGATDNWGGDIWTMKPQGPR
jgi:hypothetical protein